MQNFKCFIHVCLLYTHVDNRRLLIVNYYNLFIKVQSNNNNKIKSIVTEIYL